MTDVVTTKHSDLHRYEAHVDGEFAGFAEYELTEALIVFTHTVVEDQFEGKGVASALARFALDDVRAEGAREVVPRCPFVRGWIEKHPEYSSLVHPTP